LAIHLKKSHQSSHERDSLHAPERAFDHMKNRERDVFLKNMLEEEDLL